MELLGFFSPLQTVYLRYLEKNYSDPTVKKKKQNSTKAFGD